MSATATALIISVDKEMSIRPHTVGSGRSRTVLSLRVGVVREHAIIQGARWRNESTFGPRLTHRLLDMKGAEGFLRLRKSHCLRTTERSSSCHLGNAFSRLSAACQLHGPQTSLQMNVSRETGARTPLCFPTYMCATPKGTHLSWSSTDGWPIEDCDRSIAPHRPGKTLMGLCSCHSLDLFSTDNRSRVHHSKSSIEL